MIHPNLNINKSFIEQVDKCMNNTLFPIAQPHIRATLAKNKTRLLALLMFYYKRASNPNKSFRVLGCVIYTMIKNYVCIDYLACQ